MALIHCPECSKEVSDKAATCPNCGVSIKPKIQLSKKTIRYIIIGVGLVVLVIVLFATGIIGMSSAERQAVSDIRTLKRTLLEPDSIIIYEVAVVKNIEENHVHHFYGKTGTLVLYGARNRGGGITDDYVFILGRHISSENALKDAQAKEDTDTMRLHADVLRVKRIVVRSLIEPNPDIEILDESKIQQRVN